MQKTNERLEFLDSSRGIAALIVVIFHINGFILNNILDQPVKDFILQSKMQYLLSIILPGGNAVTYFFVLSGFVLSYSYFKKNAPVGLLSFTIRRIFRIFPLYIIIVGTAFIFKEGSFPVSVFIKEILIFPGVHKLIPPGWSMSVEISFSFLVPFFILLLQKKFNWYIALMFLSIILSRYISFYFIHFMLGVMLAAGYCSTKINLKMSASKMNLLLVAALLVFSFEPVIKGYSPAVELLEVVLQYAGIKLVYVYKWAAAIGSAFIIYYILYNEQVKKLLLLRPLVFIGKVSYGIYLVHWIVIFYIVKRFASLFIFDQVIFTYLSLYSVVIALTIGISGILYYTVELPMIRYGKKIAQRVDSSEIFADLKRRLRR